MKKITFLFASITLLTACSTASNHQTNKEIFDHSWHLTAIDGKNIPEDNRSNFILKKDYQIAGLAGCNRFFGTVTIQDNTLKGDQLGTTMMACTGQTQEIENLVLDTLAQGAHIKIEEDTLELSNEKQTLYYKKADNS